MSKYLIWTIDQLQACSALPCASAALAAQAFRLDRERGGSKTAPLPDFFIGAHAAVANLTVLTRDPSPHRSDFGRLMTLGIRLCVSKN